MYKWGFSLCRCSGAKQPELQYLVRTFVLLSLEDVKFPLFQDFSILLVLTQWKTCQTLVFCLFSHNEKHLSDFSFHADDTCMTRVQVLSALQYSARYGRCIGGPLMAVPVRQKRKVFKNIPKHKASTQIVPLEEYFRSPNENTYWLVPIPTLERTFHSKRKNPFFSARMEFKNPAYNITIYTFQQNHHADSNLSQQQSFYSNREG